MKKITKALVSENCPACKYIYGRVKYYKADKTLKTVIVNGDEPFEHMRVKATNGDPFSFFICPKCGTVILRKLCRNLVAEEVDEDAIPDDIP